jgi:hypothetical protein
MSEPDSYPRSLAKDILAPKSLVIVTGPMGSGMTDFAFRLLQYFDGHIFSTEWLYEPPPNYQRVWRLSQILGGVAAEAQSRLPFAVYIDHAGVSLLAHQSKREITRQHGCFRWLMKAVQQAEGTLILSGHGLYPNELLPHVLDGWDRVTFCQKSPNRTSVFISNYGGVTGVKYRAVPRTTWRYETRDLSMLEMDIDPKKLAQFYVELLKEMS